MKLFYYIVKIYLIILIQIVNVNSHEIEYINSFQLNGKTNFLHGIEAVNEDGNFNAVIEIPAGSNEKMGNIKKWFNNRGRIKKWCSKGYRLPRYPFNYGFVPKTIVSVDDGGDGDAIDIIILSQKKLKRA